MKHFQKILFLALAFVLLITLAACEPTQKPQTTAAPTASSKTTNAGKPWPQADMGNLPNPNREIYIVTKDSTGTSADIRNMAEEDVRAYIEKVKALGYQGEVTELGSGGIMFMGFNANGENARVIQTNTKYTVITFRPKGAGNANGASGAVIDNSTSSAKPAA